MDVTVCVASIPPRSHLLQRAIGSVLSQTLPASAIVIEIDHDHTGSAATRNRALSKVNTEWVAFLDDDDQFLPQHLARLTAAQQETGADVVYSMPLIPQHPGGHDPHGLHGAPFDPEELRRRSYIQTTTLVRTKLIQATRGFYWPADHPYDDWGAWLRLLDAGATFYHLPEQTFIWNHWGDGEPGLPGNTSGQPDRW